MFPLRNKIQAGYKFGQRTFYGASHKGTDYKADYEWFFVPFDGYVRSAWGPEGGNFLELTRPNGDIITLRHLKQSLFKTGFRVEGEFAGITGNTGAFTTNPHLHVEVVKGGKLIDPETYTWTRVLRVVVVQQGPTWASMPAKLAEIRDRLQKASNYRMDINIDVINVNFQDIPFVQYQDNYKGVDQAWLQRNISPYTTGYNIACFLLPDSASPPHGVVYGFGDADQHPPYITQVLADENEVITGGFGIMNLFVHSFIHENLGHVMKIIDGGPDVTHNFLYNLTTPSVFDLTSLCQTYNYRNIDRLLL